MVEEPVNGRFVLWSQVEDIKRSCASEQREREAQLHNRFSQLHLEVGKLHSELNDRLTPLDDSAKEVAGLLVHVDYLRTEVARLVEQAKEAHNERARMRMQLYGVTCGVAAVVVGLQVLSYLGVIGGG